MTTPIIPDTPPGVTPIVQLGIGDRYDASSIAALWDSARWSTPGVENEWGGTEPLWNDITCDVLELSTYSGRERSLDPFGIGTATVVVANLDGWADFVPPGEHDNILTIRPGRQLRVGVSIAGGAPSWLWRGVVDVTDYGYHPIAGDTVTLGCIDAKGDVGRVEMPRTLSPVGYGEFAYRRIGRALDNCLWPRWRRALDVDNVQLVATEFGTRCAAELDRTAESASGHVYGDLQGRVRFRRKDWQVWAGGTPPAATIGNVEAGDICASGWERAFPRDDVTTRAIAGRADETPVVLDNSEDSGLYGLETWERRDLLPLDNFEVSRIASRVLNVRAPETMPRIAAVTLHASTGSGEVAQLLATASPFVPTRLRCRHVTRNRLVFDNEMLVVGIKHTMSPVDGWTARLALDDALPYRNVDNPARWSDPGSRWSSDDLWAMSL